MNSQRSIPILDEDSLRAMLDELLVARLEDLGREIVEALSAGAPQQEPGPPDPMLTVSDMARLLQVDRKSIYRWRQDGVLPPCAVVGGCLRWNSSQVRTWLAERSSAEPQQDG